MKRHFQFCVLALLLPAPALAHGQQILGLPVGQMLSLGCVFIAACLLPLRSGRRIAFAILPFGAAVACWLIPSGEFIGRNFGYGMTPWFILGAVPPLLVAVGAFFAFRRRSPSDNSTGDA